MQQTDTQHMTDAWLLIGSDETQWKLHACQVAYLESTRVLHITVDLQDTSSSSSSASASISASVSATPQVELPITCIWLLQERSRQRDGDTRSHRELKIFTQSEQLVSLPPQLQAEQFTTFCLQPRGLQTLAEEMNAVHHWQETIAKAQNLRPLGSGPGFLGIYNTNSKTKTKTKTNANTSTSSSTSAAAPHTPGPHPHPCSNTPSCTSIGTMRCTGCHMQWYCSKACQKHHWNQGGHKTTCAYNA